MPKLYGAGGPWDTWNDFGDDGEETGQIIIGDHFTGSALFCSCHALPSPYQAADVELVRQAPVLHDVVVQLLALIERQDPKMLGYLACADARAVLAKIEEKRR